MLDTVTYLGDAPSTSWEMLYFPYISYEGAEIRDGLLQPNLQCVLQSLEGISGKLTPPKQERAKKQYDSNALIPLWKENPCLFSATLLLFFILKVLIRPW
jgi:hypothetical protein